MVKGCGNSCMKFLLFAFNFIFVVIGATLVSLGVYLLVKSRDFEKIVEAPDAAAILVVVVGAVTFVIAFFGCCGASNESPCMLTTYAIIVGLVFVVEVAGAILLLVYTRQITEIARDGVHKAIAKYNQNEVDNPVNGFVDVLQFSLKCCGAESKYDFYQRGRKDVPRSCCYDPLETDQRTSGRGTCGDTTDTNTATPFSVGCTKALDDFLHLFTGLLAGFLIFAGSIKIIAACFACSLRNAVY